MSDRLSGSVALVTGTSSGIGEATALALAAEGAAVALVARRTDRLEALADKIRAQGGTALPITADVSEEAQAREAVERTVAELGGLDILINNAGVMLLGPVEMARVGDWERMVQVNVLGLLYCANAALPHLLKAAEEGPRRVARAGSAVYNATKHGVGAFSEALRQEVADRRVRVSLVEPGVVATELVSHNLPEVIAESRKRFAGVEPLDSADIAESIAFMVTRPARVSINEIMVRPTASA